MQTKHQSTLRLPWTIGQTGTDKAVGKFVIITADGTLTQVTAKTQEPHALVLESDGRDGVTNNGAVIALLNQPGLVQMRLADTPGAIVPTSRLSMQDDGSVKLDTATAGDYVVGRSVTMVTDTTAGQLIEGIIHMPLKNS